jgi:protein O-GlcNAc transferase
LLWPINVDPKAGISVSSGSCGVMKRLRQTKRSPKPKALGRSTPEAIEHDGYFRALAAQSSGNLSTAASLFRTCLEHDRRHVDAWLGLGATLKDQGDFEGAENAYRTAIGLQPGVSAGFGGLAEICLKQGLLERALDHCGKAIILSRSAPKADYYIIAAKALVESGLYDEALNALTTARRIEPANPDVYFQMGLIYEDQGKPVAAFDAYQKVIGHRPKDVRAYNNMAAVLIILGQVELAIATARMAAALAPRHPDVYLNLAAALRLHGEDDEALAIYEKIIGLEPGHAEALVELCHRRQHACDWNGLASQQEEAWKNSFHKGRLVSPFIIMTASASPAEQLRCARIWGERLTKLAPAPLAPYRPTSGDQKHGKLRLGYLSADFHSHATAMLIVDMLEQHDKGRFELFGYSLGPDDGSALRQRIVNAFDHFADLRSLSDAGAAMRIHADHIDILLDLKGYTQEARVKILSYEPAPVQINYLGFPGTMGAPFIDYIIADPHVAPMEHQAFFDEKIVHLPHCYQPNDRLRALPKDMPGRASFGLPEDGFVFCCFNNPYKITPDIFDIWMRLLRETPGSVLWLLTPKKRAAENLLREASARGINPSRLVFAPFVAPEQHLARLGLGDLFLDTLPVNAHTTASEALWAGLPLITCQGETFASRVAASLLHAIEMPELVTESLEAYEALAMKLAHDPAGLAAIRKRLQDNRLKTALFDTPRYTRNFEAALLLMNELRQGGQPPRPFAVMENLE